MPQELIARYFPYVMAFAVLWNAGWVLASILYRRSQGKPVLFHGVADASFVETDASGRSNRSRLTQMVGASGCLVVAVTRDRVIIRPRFPFNLLFLPEIYGLEHEVPFERITRVEQTSDRPGRIRLEFQDAAHATQDMTLRLRNGDAFVEALSAKRR